MYLSLPNTLLSLLGVATAVSACDLHDLHRRADAAPRDWEYSDSQHWGDLKPEYALCGNGTQQSPINLSSRWGLAKTHKPYFKHYDQNVTGDLSNWGFGPSFTAHKPKSYDNWPTVTWEDKQVFFAGFHLHFPSEHQIDQDRTPAELHIVHADKNGRPAAVFGILIDVGEESYSISTVPAVPGPDDKTVTKDVPLNMWLDIEEAGYFENYWTYEGSLTTPPCDEGLRWFVSKDVMTVSPAQMRALKSTNRGRYSSRIEQRVIKQHVNV